MRRISTVGRLFTFFIVSIFFLQSSSLLGMFSRLVDREECDLKSFTKILNEHEKMDVDKLKKNIEETKKRVDIAKAINDCDASFPVKFKAFKRAISEEKKVDSDSIKTLVSKEKEKKEKHDKENFYKRSFGVFGALFGGAAGLAASVCVMAKLYQYIQFRKTKGTIGGDQISMGYGLGGGFLLFMTVQCVVVGRIIGSKIGSLVDRRRKKNANKSKKSKKRFISKIGLFADYCARPIGKLVIKVDDWMNKNKLEREALKSLYSN